MTTLLETVARAIAKAQGWRGNDLEAILATQFGTHYNFGTQAEAAITAVREYLIAAVQAKSGGAFGLHRAPLTDWITATLTPDAPAPAPVAAQVEKWASELYRICRPGGSWDELQQHERQVWIDRMQRNIPNNEALRAALEGETE